MAWLFRLVVPFGRRVSSLAGGEKRDSEESHLLKTVASGGPWHSKEQGEEALLPGSKIGPKCRRLAWAEVPVASRGEASLFFGGRREKRLGRISPPQNGAIGGTMALL